MNGDSLADAAAALLQIGGPYLGDEYHFVPSNQFEVIPYPESHKCYRMLDYMRNLETQLPRYLLEDPEFDILQWYNQQLKKLHAKGAQAEDDTLPNEDDFFFMLDEPPENPELAYVMDQLYQNIAPVIQSRITSPVKIPLELNRVQVPQGQLAAIERNAAVTRDTTRIVPKPVVVVARINGQSV